MMKLDMIYLIVSIILLLLKCNYSLLHNRIVVAGATGYIGRAVVKELVSRNINVISIVRNVDDIPDITKSYLHGSKLVECNILNPLEIDKLMLEHQPTSIINCLASRSGVKRDAFAIDYQASLYLFESLYLLTKQASHSKKHYVLLSAYCCGKPKLQFQFAKLKLENKIKDICNQSNQISYSIVRPTAFFKSLDGQLESARKGLPILYFGNGLTAANPISDKDLAIYLSNCATSSQSIDMYNECRDIGGPDIPPITKLQQISLIYDTLGIPKEKQWTISIPLLIFKILNSFFFSLYVIFEALKMNDLSQRFDDAMELTRIVYYYATEPMIATGSKEVQGSTKLSDHFKEIARKGGKLDEIDPMTTTTGILSVFTKNEYVK